MNNVMRFTRNNEEKQRVSKPTVLARYSKSTMVTGGFVALAALFWTVIALWNAWKWEKTDNAYVESEVVPLSSRIMGYVRDVPVRQNQEVRKDDVVATLDDADLRIELAVKEARFKKATSDLARARRLMGTQALAKSEFEAVEASFALARADLDATQLKLAFTHVRAPMDGVVAKLHAHKGQFVQPGQAVVTLVGASESAWVKANFKETQISKIRPGMRARIGFDTYPGVVFEGRLDSLFPSSGSVLSLIPPENATGNFTRVIQRIPAKVTVVPNARYPLRPGMSAAVEVDVADAQK